MSTLLQYSSIVTKTVGNVASGSLIPSTLGQFVGSVSFFDNLFLDRVGATINLIGTGYLSTKAAAVGTMQLTFSLNGGTIIQTAAFTPVASLVNIYWETRLLLTVRSIGAGGSIIGQGVFSLREAAGTLTHRFYPTTVTLPLDTTALQTPDLQVAWGTTNVSNTISCTNMLIEIS